MGDVVDRESTAEYIKAQLKLHHQEIVEPAPPTVAKLSKSDRKRGAISLPRSSAVVDGAVGKAAVMPII